MGAGLPPAPTLISTPSGRPARNVHVRTHVNQPTWGSLASAQEHERRAAASRTSAEGRARSVVLGGLVFGLALSGVRVNDVAQRAPRPLQRGAGIEGERLQLIDVALVPVLANLAMLQGFVDPDPSEGLIERDVGGFQVVADRGPVTVIDKDLALPQWRAFLDDPHHRTVVLIDVAEQQVIRHAANSTPGLLRHTVRDKCRESGHLLE